MMTVPKGPQCLGCPLHSMSTLMVPDVIHEQSEVMLLNRNPGMHEEIGQEIVGHSWENGKKVERAHTVQPQPLIGPTAQWLKKEFWPATQLNYDSVSRANVIKCRPNGSSDLPGLASRKTVNGI